MSELRIQGGGARTMAAGVDAQGSPLTIMRCRFPDGMPYPLTINGVEASDWKLVQTGPNSFVWEPL